ncbi:MAG: DNRLRE domain-containing protein [Bacteroidetes bacterium]|nr:DNRLRE domain-containing protein [Bacteroidota bacterium]
MAPGRCSGDVNTVTWNNQPPASSTFFRHIATANHGRSELFRIDVTNIVGDMIDNPSQNHGFQLRIFDEQLLGGALTFCSKDHTDPNKWPRIHIKFCQSPTTIFAKYDAAIGTNPSLGTSNNNYGTAAQNAAYCMTSDDNTASGHLNRALFKFDFNNIASTAVIYSAKLSLSALGASGNLSGHTGNANQSELLRAYDLGRIYRNVGQSASIWKFSSGFAPKHESFAGLY